MPQIKCFTNYLKEVFKTRFWWVILPFTLIGLVLSLVFFILSPIYMLFDLARFEFKKILYADNEKISGGAQFVKFVISYFGYFIAALITIIFLAPLSIVFFLAYCAFFISSIGRVRSNPFKFHEIEESK